MTPPQYPASLRNLMNSFKHSPCNRWNLYVITDIGMAAPRSYKEIVFDVLDGGANVIQIRDKETPFDMLADICRDLRPIFHRHDAMMIINDDPILAAESGADGIHVGQDDMSIAEVRAIVGPETIIGLSTHTKQQALDAESSGADYIGIGPIFPTLTKEMYCPALGLEMLEWAAGTLKIPFVPIGGIGKDNIYNVWRVAYRAPAVISAIMKAGNLAEATRDLINRMKKGGQ